MPAQRLKSGAALTKEKNAARPTRVWNGRKRTAARPALAHYAGQLRFSPYKLFSSRILIFFDTHFRLLQRVGRHDLIHPLICELIKES
jgi:hypothetical protein